MRWRFSPIKRIIPLLLLALILLPLFIGCNKKNDDKGKAGGPAPIRIGVLLPLTGTSAIHGKDCLVGIEIARDETNDHGGVNGRPIELIVEDTASKTASAIDALRKLIDIEKVPVVLGPISTAETLAGATVADRAKIVLFSPTAASPEIHGISPYVFRIGLMTTPQGKRMAEYCYQKLGIKSMGILAMNDETGIAYADAFQSAYESFGGKISDRLSYLKSDTEFRTVLTKLKNAKVSNLYVTSVPTTMGYIARQATELAYRPKFFTNAGVEGEDLLTIAGNAAEGIVFTGLAPSEDFLKKFEMRAKRQPGIAGPQGYDAFEIIVNALKARGDDREGIRQYLAKMPPYEGVGGTISFDETGEIVRVPHLKVVADGKFKRLVGN
ncbi:MAG: penicillin-binding protein activator [Thermodesulfovibrionales bacterium]